jgi:hypothetical protein
MSYLPCHYLYISFVYCTWCIPTISILNLAIFPCYSNQLLRRRRWTRILRRGVLGYVLPRLPFLWWYGVFLCSISLPVILVSKDIIYVIIILYIHDIWLSVSTFSRMCGTIDPGSCIWWVLGFGIKPVMTGREGPTVPIQLCGALQSPNRIVTHVVNITCTDNASNTSSTALSRIFHLIKADSRHTWSPYTRLILKHGTIYTTRQTPILLYGI